MNCYPTYFFSGNRSLSDLDRTNLYRLGRNFPRDFFDESDSESFQMLRSQNIFTQSPLERMLGESSNMMNLSRPNTNFISLKQPLHNRMLHHNLEDQENLFFHHKELQPKQRSSCGEMRLYPQNPSSKIINNGSIIRNSSKTQTARRLQEVNNYNFANSLYTPQSELFDTPFIPRSFENEYPNNLPRERYCNTIRTEEEAKEKEEKEKEQRFEDDFADDSQDNAVGPEDLKRLKDRLQIYGMKEKTNIKGDGNCQFAAFSDQIYGNIERSAEIRHRCVQWLRSNKNFTLSNGAKLEDFLQTEFFPTWDLYCDYMESNGTWGDNLTLVALAEVYQTMIVIISSIKIADNQSPCTVVTPSNWDQKKIAYMSHLHEIHYSSICPDNDG